MSKRKTQIFFLLALIGITLIFAVTTTYAKDKKVVIAEFNWSSAIISANMMSYVLDGLNLTRQMRGDPELKDVPIIMISAIVSREEAGVFPTDEHLSVDAFLTKPVDPAVLLDQVAKLLESRQ